MAVALRQDLEIVPGQPDEDGTPCWVLHDPAAHRYFRLPWIELEMLSFLSLGTPAAIAEATQNRIGRPVTADRAERLLRILAMGSLVAGVGDGQRRRLMLMAGRSAGPPGLSGLLARLLSVRIGLVNPDRWLARILPAFGWWFHPATTVVVAVLAGLGLMLAVRQWDLFVGGFAGAFEGLGALWYALGLSAVKAAHEFSHAITAKRQGCRVPSMGVALLVFWPVLYTDCSDAWRLRSRRQRLAVDAAGVKAELAIAALCLLAWAILPDGPLRGLCQLLAATNLILTMLINLNPLMRFDGYYMLSDLTGAANLQPRAAALLRWRLREALFGLGLDPPERPRRWMLVYGAASQVYRLTLVYSIALMVYGYLFKLAGLALVLAQTWGAVVRPLLAEGRALARDRRRIRPARLVLTLLGCGLALTLLLVPWRDAVVMSAHVQAVRTLVVYARTDGRVVGFAGPQGATVRQGETVLELATPELDQEMAVLASRIEGLRRQLALRGLDLDLLGQSAVLQSDLESSQARLAKLSERRGRNSLQAPFDGVAVDVSPELRRGLWVGEGERLFTLVDPTAWEAVAYVREDDLGRIAPEAGGRFIPADGMHPPLPVTVIAVEVAALRDLDSPYAAAPHGGDVPVRAGEGGELIPLQATYRVRLSVPPQPSLQAGMAGGHVVLEGHAESLARRAVRRVMGVWRRESGF